MIARSESAVQWPVLWKNLTETSYFELLRLVDGQLKHSSTFFRNEEKAVSVGHRQLKAVIQYCLYVSGCFQNLDFAGLTFEKSPQTEVSITNHLL